jgi:hypothetical protein
MGKFVGIGAVGIPGTPQYIEFVIAKGTPIDGLDTFFESREEAIEAAHRSVRELGLKPGDLQDNVKNFTAEIVDLVEFDTIPADAGDTEESTW